MISLSLYQDIFEASDVGMVIADLSGRLTKVNNSVCSCLGYTKEELESKTFHEITYGADLEKDVYHIEEIKQGLIDSYRTQKRYITKSGQLVWADLTITAFRTSDKRVNYFFAVIKNIDQLKHSQDLLHARNEELEAIFATSKDGIAVLDLQGNFLKVNNAYSEITGYTEAELLTRSCTSMSISEDVPRIQTTIAEVIEKGYVENFEKSCCAKDGSILTINMSIAMMPNQKNLLVTSKNVTKEVFLRLELEKQREQYQQLMEFASDGIYIMDFDGRLLECNQRAAQMLGYSVEEMKKLVVTDWDAMIPASEIPALIHSVSTDNLISFETKHRRKDGSLYDAAITSVKIIIGTKEFLYASVRDITHQKQIENELIETNKKLTNISENIPGVIYTYQLFADGRSCFPYASDQIYDIFGVTPSDVRDNARKILEVVHPEDSARVARTISASFEKLSGWEDEYRVNHPDKGLIWLKGLSKPEKQSDGSVLWYGYIYDITERKIAELEIQKAKDYYEKLLEYASDGVHILDMEGNVIACSRSFSEHLGYEYDEVKQLNVREWDCSIPAERLPSLIKEMQVTSQTFESKHRKKDGTIVFVQINARGIELNDQCYLYASARDISESVRLKEELERYSEKLEERVHDEMQRRVQQEAMLIHQSRLASMGEMIGIIAHQWRQPINFLNVILFNLKDLHQQNALSTVLFETSYQQAVETTRQLSHIIEDFRNFFNPSKTQESFSLLMIIWDAIAFLDNIFNLKNIDISIGVDSELQITGYKNEILQIFINVFSNSLEAFSASGNDQNSLLVQADKINNEIFIKVVDSGGGIPADMIDTLFDPYVSSKKATHGTGLGLYMCKLIIEEHHGGKIAAFSKEGNTTFTMTIPVR